MDESDRLAALGQVRETLANLMEIERFNWDANGVLTLRGRLLQPAETIYPAIRARMERLGYTPFLRKADGSYEIQAIPGVIERTRPRIVMPLLLFVLTIFTTLLTGALHQVDTCVDSTSALMQLLLHTATTPAALLAGLPFAGTLLGILFVHEMGHYIVGRLRNAPVSLPYFIPMPPGLTITGTMGAVIVQREPMEDRRTILEIGIAGPLAGLLVAIPLLFYGLSISTVGGPPPPPPGCPPGYLQEGNSLLYIAAKWLVFGRFLPSGGVDVQLSPVAFGAWIGLLVTMLNLLPVGQLDGGHISYALLGRKADYLAYALIGICIVMGITVSSTWMIWGVLAMLIGPRHPPPLNDAAQIRGWHVALAILGLIVFALLLMPDPLREVGG